MACFECDVMWKQWLVVHTASVIAASHLGLHSGGDDNIDDDDDDDVVVPGTVAAGVIQQ